MGLVDGYYGTTKEVFGFSSKRTTFRKGIGLPGRVCELAGPVFIADLGKSDLFLRADDTMRVGINRGLGIPCETLTDHSCVMTFLSALDTPIAKRFDIWVPAANGNHLYRSEGFSERMGHLPAWEEDLQRAEISALVALPLIRDGRLQGVFVWYF